MVLPLSRKLLSLWIRALAGCFIAGVLCGCASLAERGQVPASHAFPPEHSGYLGKLVQSSTPEGLDSDHSGFRLLHDGLHALDARVALAQNAQASLDVQYYILARDASGAHFVHALRAAAARGVRVRLLVDDLYASEADDLLLELQKQAGFEVRLFNPLPARGGSLASRVVRSLHEFRRINHRMHNKLLIADGVISVSGGRNIADEYFMRSLDANFVDMDVLAAGDVVRQQGVVFDTYWNSESSYPITTIVQPVSVPARRRPFPSNLVDLDLVPGEPDVFGNASLSVEIARGRMHLTWARARVLADAPEKIRAKEPHLRFMGSVSEHVLRAFGESQSELFLSSPYFIPGEPGIQILRQLRRSNVAVTLVTNSLGATDAPLVHARYVNYREAMLDMGVVVYEVSPLLTSRFNTLGPFKRSKGRLHSKLAVIDKRWFYIGSMNLDRRSASLNTESGLLIDSPILVAEFERLLEIDRFRSAYRVQRDSAGRTQWLESDEAGGRWVKRHEPDASFANGFLNGLWLLFVDEEWL